MIDFSCLDSIWRMLQAAYLHDPAQRVHAAMRWSHQMANATKLAKSGAVRQNLALSCLQEIKRLLSLAQEMLSDGSHEQAANQIKDILSVVSQELANEKVQ